MNILNFLTIFMATISIFIGMVCFLKNKKSFINIFYLLAICFLVLWMISLHCGYYFIDNVSLSLLFIRLTFGFGALGSACICIFTYFYPRRDIILSGFVKGLYVFVTIGVVLISSFTDLVYEKEIIINGLEIQDIHGSLHIIFVLYYFLNFFFATTFLILKMRVREGIARIKVELVLLGIIGLVIPTLLFHMILPRFGIYLFQTEVVYFNFIFIALAGYSMLKYRFLNVKFTITRIVKQGFSILFTVLFVSGIWGLIQLSPILSLYQPVLMPMMYVVAIFMYFYILRGLVADLFHKFFGLTSIEYFRDSLASFTKQSTLYATVESFDNALKKLFQTVHIESVKIIPLTKKNQKKYMEFMRFFEKNPKILVQNEQPFLPTQQQLIFQNTSKDITFSQEICIPLFRSPKVLLGFFVLGKKQFNDLYSTEEIKTLEEFKRFLELRMVGILYSDYLKREVEKKTQSLKEKNKELKESNEKLQLLDEAKDTFLSIASHELRTPMTVIGGFTDLLLSDGEGNLTEKQKNFLTTISQNTNDLTTLVNKMLDISSLEAGKMEFVWEEIKFPEILQSIVQEFEPLCREKNIHLEFENPKEVQLVLRSDSQKLKQIMRNLVGNALKFTPENGKIFVRLELGNKLNTGAKISIIDTGIGIPKQEQRMIFDKFHRTKHSTQITYVGTGLGLHIVKLLVEALGGEIFVKSEKNKGACFTFFIPDTK